MQHFEREHQIQIKDKMNEMDSSVGNLLSVRKSKTIHHFCILLAT